MATEIVTINSGSGTNGWTQVADDAENFILESLSVSEKVYVRFAAAAPDAGAIGHEVVPGSPMVRAGVDGDVWVRTTSDVDMTVLISVGAR